MSALTEAQRAFLLLGSLHPIGRMPYYPDDHPVAAELKELGLIEYSSVKHRRLMTADEMEQLGRPAQPRMVDCTSFGYFVTDAGRAALSQEIG